MAEETEEGPSKFANRFASCFDPDGSIINNEGPGKGFASRPWAIDDYERDLGIDPAESWLVSRILKYQWAENTAAFPSFQKITENAMVARATLDKTKDQLLKKGYLSIFSRGALLNSGRPDRKVRYTAKGVLTALVVAITCNPNSKWANTPPDEHTPPGSRIIQRYYSGLSPNPGHNLDIRTPADLNAWYNAAGLYLDWATMTVHKLTELEPPGYVYTHTCGICGKPFEAKSHQAKYCNGCKRKRDASAFQAFVSN